MSDSPAARAWSSAQLIRLESEWRRLQRSFAFHPNVEVTPLAGDPPGEYQVRYKLTTLAVDAAGQLAYVPEMPVHLWLPPHFPHEAPVVRPMAAAFHPNVSMEWVHLSPAWRPNGTLVEVVTQVGQMLAFHSYDPNAVINPVAMSWVYSNLALLPTDPADCSADAGGEPLARVARLGPGLVEALRAKVEAVLDRLASAAPPPAQEVREFVWQARSALSLFDDPDVPSPLRTAAVELEEAVLSARGTNTVWAQVARQVATAEAAGAAVATVAEAEEALRKALDRFEQSEPRPDRAGPEPATAPPAGPLAGLLPPATIQPLAMDLRQAVRGAEQSMAELRARLAQLAPPPRAASHFPGGVLARRLEREAARAAQAAEPARASGAVLASVEPVLNRARRESAALDRLAAWAEFADLMSRGDELARRLSGADPARFNAYFVSAPAGEAGPLEYERPTDFDGRVVAVSNRRGTSLRIVDCETEELVAAGDGTLPLPPRGAAATSAPSSVTLRPGERTDELRVQIEYLLTQTREALNRLVPDGKPPEDAAEWATDSWAGRRAAALDVEDVGRRVLDERRRAGQAWKGLLAELAAVGRYKQRLATHHLLARLIEFVPRARARVDRARDTLARADARLAEIAARSARDLETDQLMIPQHLAGEYGERLAERDRARKEIASAGGSLQAVAERVRNRLAKPRALGSAEVPSLQILGAMPAGLLSLAQYLTDDHINAHLARLEGLLEVSLGGTGGGRAGLTAAGPRPV